MRILNISLAVVVAASALVAAPAMAAGPRVTDGELLRASRCLGLAKAQSLGAIDASTITAFVKSQRIGRDSVVRSRSDTAEDKAMSEAGRAKDDAKAALVAERDGACKTFIGGSAGV